MKTAGKKGIVGGGVTGAGIGAVVGSGTSVLRQAFKNKKDPHNRRSLSDAAITGAAKGSVVGAVGGAAAGHYAEPRIKKSLKDKIGKAKADLGGAKKSLRRSANAAAEEAGSHATKGAINTVKGEASNVGKAVKKSIHDRIPKPKGTFGKLKDKIPKSSTRMMNDAIRKNAERLPVKQMSLKPQAVKIAPKPKMIKPVAPKPPIPKTDAIKNFMDETKEASNKLKGGLADKKQISDFPRDQLVKGMRVEREHTNDPAKAKEIAMDHLVEDKKYYDKLEKMEKKAFLGFGKKKKPPTHAEEMQLLHKIESTKFNAAAARDGRTSRAYHVQDNGRHQLQIRDPANDNKVEGVHEFSHWNKDNGTAMWKRAGVKPKKRFTYLKMTNHGSEPHPSSPMAKSN